MQNEYYGVASTPTEDYLAHYGVKGMKWGVRRALSSKHADRKLARQYRKASKKLEKLSKRADIGIQSKRAKKFGVVAGISGGIGLAGAGLQIPMTKQYKALKVKHQKLGKIGLDNLSAKISEQKEAMNLLGTPEYKKVADEINRRHDTIHKNVINQMNKTKAAGHNVGVARLGSGAVGIAGLATSGITGAKALAAKYRTTKKGHAKAVAKRDAWANEMSKVFAGTKYGKRKQR